MDLMEATAVIDNFLVKYSIRGNKASSLVVAPNRSADV